MAIGPVACAGRAHLKALLVGGRVVVEDDQIPNVDLKALAFEAQQAVKTLQQRVLVA